MKKILCVASTISHILNFHMPYINALKQEPENYQVFTMAKGDGKNELDFDIDFHKKMFSLKNLKAKKEIYKILKKENFDVIFLNTSLAAFFVRLAVKKLKKKPIVINIAHGYLFDKKTGFVKKTLLSTAEKYVKNVTDYIITMNGEDYEYAKSHRLAKKGVFNIQGMGIQSKRTNGDAYSDDFSNGYTFTFIGELSGRKNQGELIRFIKRLDDDGVSAKLNLVGEGGKKQEYIALAKDLEISKNVNFLGYTKDIEKVLKQTNFYVASSKIEGLPFNIVEAMNAGQIVISADTKGTVDIIKNGENGMIYELGNIDDFVKKFYLVKDDIKLQEKLRENAKITAKNYLIDAVFDENISLFKKLINS